MNFTSDTNYANVNFSCRVSADGERSFTSQNVTFLVDIFDEKHITILTVKRDEKDDNYSLTVFRSPVTNCILAKGVLSTIVDRMFFANFAQSSRFNVSCSYPKNTPLIIDDLPIDDHLLPPMVTEKQFKLHTKFFAKVKGRKGYSFTYESTVYGRFKK